MKVTAITCHQNADFDALASLIGASLLYPGAMLIFPGTQEKSLQRFYEDALRWLYDFVPPRDAELSRVERLVIVDACQAERIPHVRSLLERPDVEIHVWDHHPCGEESIRAQVEHIEMLGSTCTLLTRFLREKGIPLRCEEASLLGLGIYGDTGAFTYVSTTPEDFDAASWLLGQGMDLALIAGLVRHDLTKEQLKTLNDLLESAELHDLGGVPLALACARMDHYMSDFAALAPRFMDMQPCRVFFALGAMEDMVQVVARSQEESLDVGKVCAQLGGGGHRYAASASVRDKSLPELRDAILALVSIQASPVRTASMLMSSPAIGIRESGTLEQADSLMARYGLKAVPVLDSAGCCTGLLEYQLTVKALSHGLGAARAADYMQRSFQVVARQAGLQVLMDIIVGARQRLVPVVDADKGADGAIVSSDGQAPDTLKSLPLIGVVTRTDLIRLFMDDDEIRLPQPRQKRERTRSLSGLMKSVLPGPCLSLLRLAGELGAGRGVSVYVVGGFVRDMLMTRRKGRWPHMDVDLVVEGSALPFARDLAGRLGGRVREHREFMTALVLFPLRSIDPGASGEEEFRVDVATARLEYYTSPAALPTVELSSIKMDLYRRDFTINAMAVQLDDKHFGQLVDFFDGQEDIRRKRIRVLHALSFVEDPTRALRAVRFEQRYAFRIGPQCDRLIRNALELGLMERLSGARVCNELELMLEEENPFCCFSRMQEFGILEAVHHELDMPPWKAELLRRTLDVFDWYRRLYQDENPDPLTLCLLALCRNCSAQELEDVLSRLTLPEKRAARLKDARMAIMNALPRVLSWQKENGRPGELHRMLRRVPLEGLLYLVARVEDEDLRRKLTHYVYRERLIAIEISGDDLRNMGLAPGPVYGRILDEVLMARQNGDVGGREAQLRYAGELAAAEIFHLTAGDPDMNGTEEEF